MALRGFSTAKRQHPDGYPGHMLIPPHSEDLWHATTGAADLYASHSSTSHSFLRHPLSRWSPGIALAVIATRADDALLEWPVLFFNVSMTVVGLLCSTRAISRIPLPCMVISTICCLTSGILL